MKHATLLTIFVGLLIMLTGCMMTPEGTIYVLDNNQPPRPVVLAAPPPAMPPPAAVVEEAPPLVVVEDVPEVYYVRTIPNMFFFGAAWYYYYGGFWYRSDHYRGPWVSIEISRVPGRFYRIPEHHFRNAGPPPRYERREGGREEHNEPHRR